MLHAAAYASAIRTRLGIDTSWVGFDTSWRGAGSHLRYGDPCDSCRQICRALLHAWHSCCAKRGPECYSCVCARVSVRWWNMVRQVCCRAVCCMLAICRVCVRVGAAVPVSVPAGRGRKAAQHARRKPRNPEVLTSTCATPRRTHVASQGVAVRIRCLRCVTHRP